MDIWANRQTDSSERAIREVRVTQGEQREGIQRDQAVMVGSSTICNTQVGHLIYLAYLGQGWVMA